MALKDDIQKLEKLLDTWSTALSRSSDPAAVAVGKDIEGYARGDFKYKLKDHFSQAMKQFDERFYM